VKSLDFTPASGKNQTFTADVTEVREYVDPIEQTTDWFNVISWAMGDPMVDKNRIGIRGPSYSGGHVFYVAAHDPRVKAAVSQAGAFDSRWFAGDDRMRQQTYEEGAQRTRGAAYPAPRAVVVGSLIGAPIREKLMLSAPGFRHGDAPQEGLGEEASWRIAATSLARWPPSAGA
jgi:hypothetical protein